jgi:acetyl esterase
MRERRCSSAFIAANLMYGFYDLGLTPSAKHSDGAAVINRPLLEVMSASFRGTMEASDPRVSPIFADLSDLPSALFTVGTLDPLLDDSLFMHMRWQTAGNPSELALYPGGFHAFNLLGGQLAADANTRAALFLKQSLDQV